MKTPTLSVIMGNYNHAHYLVESIPAILNQSFRPKELIIIDDASTDNSVEIIERFAKQDSVVRFYKNEKNMGNVATFLKAFELMTGDYFTTAAADDLVLPGLFEKSMKMLAKYPHAGLCSAISRRIDEQGNELTNSPEPPYISKTPYYLPPEKVLEFELKGVVWCMGQTAVWRAEAVKQSGAFSLEFGDFIDGISIPLVTLNYGACFVPEVLGMVRTLGNSFSDKFRYHPKSYMDLMKKSEKIMLSEAYASKFPTSFRDVFRKQSNYQMGAIALYNWENSNNYYYENLLKTFPNPSFMNRVVICGSKILSKFQYIILKLFLFSRLRKLSWLMIHRVFLRFMKKLEKKQE